MDQPTGSAVLCRLQAAGAVPGHAVVIDHKARADWVERDLLMRLQLHHAPGDELAWTLFVGDRLLGLPFDEGGILALVPVRPVAAAGDEPWPWPASHDSAGALVERLAPLVLAARSFVADRRDLCGLLLADADVHRGALVADLHTALSERIVRALAVARAAGAADIEADALARLRSESGDGPTSLRNEARFWAEQWTYQSGHRISIPGDDDPAPPSTSHRELPPPFWERMG